MKESDKKYIQENRLKESMLGMAKDLGISYNRVRNYMITENLMLTKKQVQKIQVAKTKITKSKMKPWNWDALI